MIKPPSEIVKQYLVDQAAVVEPAGSLSLNSTAWPCFLSNEPDRKGVPHNVVTIYDTEGVKDGRLHNTKEVIEHPGVQVRIRASTFTLGWDKVQDIITAVDAAQRAAVDVGSLFYFLDNASRIGPPLPIGVQEGTRRRELFTINLLLTIREDRSLFDIIGSAEFTSMETSVDNFHFLIHTTMPTVSTW